jgi:SAM-dependent methyltransferase
MTNPHTGHGPATPPAGARRGSVPGPADLGVPVTIWPGLPAPAAGHSPAACPGPVTAAAAARVITAFSRPGDLVAAPDGSPAVIEASAAAGRRILGVIHAGEHAVTGLLATAAPAARLRPGGPGALLAPGDPDAAQAALAIAGCHGAGCCCPEPGGGDDPALVYAACHRVLAPGGVLAILTANRTEGGQLADLAGHAVPAARAAGLFYAQHIVLVHAAIDGDHLTPDPADTAPASRAGATQIHSDLLVFTKP